MESQIDFFDATQESVVSGKRKVSASLPNYFFKWVILFQRNISENIGQFKIFERDLFPEIKNDWILGQLRANSRFKKLKKLSGNEDGIFSLFAKIEAGKSDQSSFHSTRMANNKNGDII